MDDGKKKFEEALKFLTERFSGKGDHRIKAQASSGSWLPKDDKNIYSISQAGSYEQLASYRMSSEIEKFLCNDLILGDEGLYLTGKDFDGQVTLGGVTGISLVPYLEKHGIQVSFEDAEKLLVEIDSRGRKGNDFSKSDQLDFAADVIAQEYFSKGGVADLHPSLQKQYLDIAFHRGPAAAAWVLDNAIRKIEGKPQTLNPGPEPGLPGFEDPRYIKENPTLDEVTQYEKAQQQYYAGLISPELDLINRANQTASQSTEKLKALNDTMVEMRKTHYELDIAFDERILERHQADSNYRPFDEWSVKYGDPTAGRRSKWIDKGDNGSQTGNDGWVNRANSFLSRYTAADLAKQASGYEFTPIQLSEQKKYAPAEMSPPAKSPSASTAEEQPQSQSVTHQIKEGETLGNIASQYGTTAEAIRRANMYSEDAPIYEGETLVIPKSEIASSPVAPALQPAVSTGQPAANTPSSVIIDGKEFFGPAKGTESAPAPAQAPASPPAQSPVSSSTAPQTPIAETTPRQSTQVYLVMRSLSGTSTSSGMTRAEVALVDASGKVLANGEVNSGGQSGSWPGLLDSDIAAGKANNLGRFESFANAYYPQPTNLSDAEKRASVASAKHVYQREDNLVNRNEGRGYAPGGNGWFMRFMSPDYVDRGAHSVGEKGAFGLHFDGPNGGSGSVGDGTNGCGGFTDVKQYNAFMEAYNKIPVQDRPYGIHVLSPSKTSGQNLSDIVLAANKQQEQVLARDVTAPLTDAPAKSQTQTQENLAQTSFEDARTAYTNLFREALKRPPEVKDIVASVGNDIDKKKGVVPHCEYFARDVEKKKGIQGLFASNSGWALDPMIDSMHNGSWVDASENISALNGIQVGDPLIFDRGKGSYSTALAQYKDIEAAAAAGAVDDKMGHYATVSEVARDAKGNLVSFKTIEANRGGKEVVGEYGYSIRDGKLVSPGNSHELLGYINLEAHAQAKNIDLAASLSKGETVPIPDGQNPLWTARKVDPAWQEWETKEKGAYLSSLVVGSQDKLQENYSLYQKSLVPKWEKEIAEQSNLTGLTKKEYALSQQSGWDKWGVGERKLAYALLASEGKKAEEAYAQAAISESPEGAKKFIQQYFADIEKNFQDSGLQRAEYFQGQAASLARYEKGYEIAESFRQSNIGNTTTAPEAPAINTPQQAYNSLQQQGIERVVFYGDSHALLTHDYLQDAGVQTLNLGNSGAGLRNVGNDKKGLSSLEQIKKGDLVYVSIGANDVGMIGETEIKGQYTTDFREKIKSIQAQGGKPVVVAMPRPTDEKYTDDWHAKYTTLSEQQGKIAAELGVPFYDYSDLSSEVAPRSADGLHMKLDSKKGIDVYSNLFNQSLVAYAQSTKSTPEVPAQIIGKNDKLVANLHALEGEVKQALKHCQEAEAVLADSDPSQPTYIDNLKNLKNNIGIIHSKIGEISTFLETHKGEQSFLNGKSSISEEELKLVGVIIQDSNTRISMLDTELKRLEALAQVPVAAPAIGPSDEVMREVAKKIVADHTASVPMSTPAATQLVASVNSAQNSLQGNEYCETPAEACEPPLGTVVHDSIAARKAAAESLAAILEADRNTVAADVPPIATPRPQVSSEQARIERLAGDYRTLQGNLGIMLRSYNNAEEALKSPEANPLGSPETVRKINQDLSEIARGQMISQVGQINKFLERNQADKAKIIAKAGSPEMDLSPAYKIAEKAQAMEIAKSKWVNTSVTEIDVPPETPAITVAANKSVTPPKPAEKPAVASKPTKDIITLTSPEGVDTSFSFNGAKQSQTHEITPDKFSTEYIALAQKSIEFTKPSAVGAPLPDALAYNPTKYDEAKVQATVAGVIKSAEVAGSKPPKPEEIVAATPKEESGNTTGAPDESAKDPEDKSAAISAAFKENIYVGGSMRMLQRGSAQNKSEVEFLQKTLVDLGYLQTTDKAKEAYINPEHFGKMDGMVTVEAVSRFQSDFRRELDDSDATKGEIFKAESPHKVKVFLQTWSALEAAVKTKTNEGVQLQEAAKIYKEVAEKNTSELVEAKKVEDKKSEIAGIAPKEAGAPIQSSTQKAVGS